MKATGLRAVLILSSALALTAPWVTAQPRPRLAEYFTEISSTLLSTGYAPLDVHEPMSADLNGDGDQDLVVLGANYPGSGVYNVPQPGRVFFGDGNGRFAPAPTSLFPVDTLMTVHPGKTLFADFNGDDRQDMFISSLGYDGEPWPGEQNRLYLSRPDGGWLDETANLPQLNDFSDRSSVGDISGRGLIDIFVGNGYARLDRNPIQPYTLVNTGSGQFTMTRTNIPVGNNQMLDPLTAHNFPNSTITDLNGDGLSELIITAVLTANSKNRHTTILWNRAGAFAQTDTTELPAPEIYPDNRMDTDVRRIDVNQDGLPDLVLVGSQTTYRGWFVQILVNKGNRQFADETADRVPAEVSSGAGPNPSLIHVLDFNQDGAPDFFVEFRPAFGVAFAGFPPGLPFLWLNDGAGRFSTLNVGDFVAAGRELSVFNRRPHLIATRNGYSILTQQFVPQNGNLRVFGLLATKPYRLSAIALRK